MTCTCQHIALTHRYVTATRSNVGECLALGCGCAGFEGAESAQDPLEMGGLSVDGRYPRGINQDGPGDPLLAQRVGVPGPRPTLDRSAEL